LAFESVAHSLGRVGDASSSDTLLHGLSAWRLLDGQFLVALGLLAKETCLQLLAVKAIDPTENP